MGKSTSIRFKNLLFTFIAIIMTGNNVFCQEKESVVVKHSPKKATIMSACIPGLGQAYNRKYWKIPIIYAGAATIGYLIHFNNKYYKDYNKAYILRNDGDSNTIDIYVNKYTSEDLLTLKNFYRRDLELSFIAGFALYVLNVIDADVDAHLYKFDIGDDLSLSTTPSLLKIGNSFNPGITLSLSFHQISKKIHL